MEKGRKNPRMRLKPDEAALIENYRAIKQQSKSMGLDPKTVHSGWLKTKDASLYFQNPEFGGKGDALKFKDDVVKSVKDHAPKYKKFKRENSKEGHLLVIDPADCHIGKLASEFETGKEYNSQIAVKRILEGVQGVLNKSQGFNIDKINFIGGNDILHTDNAKSSTTAGTPQDTSQMWYDNFIIAKQVYIDVIDLLLQVADVHFTFNPSNHDYISGFMLAQVIEAHYSKCKQVSFDVNMMHRKYFMYGTNLIGTTHGDGAKNNDLGALMSVEAKHFWAASEYRYFYTHHVHHKTSKDYIGVTVESLRSPSESDSWHHRNGYTGNVKAIEGFIHSKNNGQVARLTHNF